MHDLEAEQAKRFAAARPMPLAPPVMTATRPARWQDDGSWLILVGLPSGGSATIAKHDRRRHTPRAPVERPVNGRLRRRSRAGRALSASFPVH